MKRAGPSLSRVQKCLAGCEDSGSHRELGSCISQPHLLLSEYPDERNLKEKEFSCGGGSHGPSSLELQVWSLCKKVKRMDVTTAWLASNFFIQSGTPASGIVAPRV